MEISLSLFKWESDFPSVYSHTSISFLKKISGFNEAKNGDMQTALSIVKLCIKQNKLKEIKNKYPKAILLPIISNNKLPEAFATTISKNIGLEIYTDVYIINIFKRKTLSAIERLLFYPNFKGNIKSNKCYIIVDDVVTQGGTISALRRYIIICGGYVVAVIALACSTDSQMLTPKHDYIVLLIDKFGYKQINTILQSYKIADDIWELTNSQVKYLLKFKNADRIVEEIRKVLKVYNVKESVS